MIYLHKTEHHNGKLAIASSVLNDSASRPDISRYFE